jgi:large subunit ribosomal protein L13
VQDIKVSGKKAIQKKYQRHSGRPGSLKIETFEKLQERIPEKILEIAVKGMLPKGALGRKIFKNLKVYKGELHPHISQNPQLLI